MLPVFKLVRGQSVISAFSHVIRSAQPVGVSVSPSPSDCMSSLCDKRTFSTPQLDGSVFCSQPSVAQEQLHFWVLGSVRLRPLGPPADLHPAAVPGQIRESGPRLQMKLDQKQAAQSLVGLDQNRTSL